MPSRVHTLSGASPSRRALATRARTLPALAEVGRETSVDNEPLLSLFQQLRDLGAPEAELAQMVERSQLVKMLAQLRSAAAGRAAKDTGIRAALGGGQTKSAPKPGKSPPSQPPGGNKIAPPASDGAAAMKKKKTRGAATDNLDPLPSSPSSPPPAAKASPTNKSPKPKRNSSEPVGAGLANKSGSPLYPSLRSLWPDAGINGWMQWMVKFAECGIFTAEQLLNGVKAASGMPMGLLKLPKEAMFQGKARLINELIMTRTPRQEWINDVDMGRVLDLLQLPMAALAEGEEGGGSGSAAPLPPGFDLKTTAQPALRSMEHALLCALICTERLDLRPKMHMLNVHTVATFIERVEGAETGMSVRNLTNQYI